MTKKEAIKVLRTESIELGGNAVSVCRFWEALDMAVKALEDVPVVRCRECKHHHDCGTHFCDALGMDCPDDSEFFCSYGERRGGQA